MDSQNRSGESSQFLGFSVAGEEYGVGILQVKEILEYEAVTRVPSTPPSIRGVINLRGSVVPVVDLAVKFGLPESEVTKRSCIVVLEVAIEGEKVVMGVIADAVSQVVDLCPEDIEPVPAFGPRAHVDYLLGLGKAERKFILLLDIDRLLSEDELQAASAAAEVAESVAP